MYAGDRGEMVSGETVVGALCAVVAIPVRDEAERIEVCLDALEAQQGVGRGELGVLLLLNNCTDDTAAILARRVFRQPCRVIERVALEASAGWARREAMEAAAAWLDEARARDGLILTTDADSRVSRDWVALNRAAIGAGAHAVFGRVALDPDEAALLPAALHARGALESAYEALLVELAALADPIEQDPWPRHWTASGASLCVRLSAYRRVGGMPALSAGEDRAFERRLLACDIPVRHAPEIVVTTSGRLEGRARGGAADTMRLRCDAPESPCDPKLEAVSRSLFRFVWRRRLRALHAAGRLSVDKRGIRALRPPRRARAIADLRCAGEMIQAIEEASPRLRPAPVRPADLPRQIRRARTLLGLMKVARRTRALWRAWARGRALRATGEAVET